VATLWHQSGMLSDPLARGSIIGLDSGICRRALPSKRAGGHNLSTFGLDRWLGVADPPPEPLQAGLAPPGIA